MKKLSGLEAMRLHRDQREDEVTAPYRAEIVRAGGIISSLRKTVRTMEEFMGRAIAKHVIEQIGHDVSHRLMRLIYEAVAKAKGPSEPVKIMLPADVLRFMDPKSIESRIVRDYTDYSLPSLGVRLDSPAEMCATIIDIRVPELGCRRIIAN